MPFPDEDRIPDRDGEVGSPLSSDMDISFEHSVVWVRGRPDDYPYLRETR
jgi:hypothetical protein